MEQSAESLLAATFAKILARGVVLKDLGDDTWWIRVAPETLEVHEEGHTAQIGRTW